MIGFLRFIGLMNAAAWLGTAIFFTFGAHPACFSADLKATLGLNADSYYPGAVAGIIMSRYYHVMLACAVLAVLHFLAEWIYMGRPRRKFSLGLVIALFALTLLGSNVMQPSLVRLIKKHYTSPQAVERDSARRNFRILNVTEIALNLVLIGGLILYTWRAGSSSDTLRFVSPVQFRS